MRSVNFALRKVYFAALTGITYNSVPIKIFYQKAPSEISDENYIVFGGVSSNDTSAKFKAQTDTSIRVTVHSYKSIYNDGQSTDNISDQVIQRIYPDKQNRPDMSADNLQIINTELSNDFTQSYNLNGSREYIDRVLTFRHQIFHS